MTAIRTSCTTTGSGERLPLPLSVSLQERLRQGRYSQVGDLPTGFKSGLCRALAIRQLWSRLAAIPRLEIRAGAVGWAATFRALGKSDPELLDARSSLRDSSLPGRA